MALGAIGNTSLHRGCLFCRQAGVPEEKKAIHVTNHMDELFWDPVLWGNPIKPFKTH